MEIELLNPLANLSKITKMSFNVIFAVLLATAAAVMSIKYFDNSFKNDHQRIGLAFYVAMWLQAFTGIFRPPRGRNGRQIWFLVHWLVGTTVSLLGIVNIYTGLRSYQERTSKEVRIWTIIFTVEMLLLLFIYILQEKWHYIHKKGQIIFGSQDTIRPTEQEIGLPDCLWKEVTVSDL